MTMVTEQELVVGSTITVRLASNTISRATYNIKVEIVWIENGHVHYRRDGNATVEQTPVERFLDIVNNPPRAWH